MQTPVIELQEPLSITVGGMSRMFGAGDRLRFCVPGNDPHPDQLHVICFESVASVERTRSSFGTSFDGQPWAETLPGRTPKSGLPSWITEQLR